MGKGTIVSGGTDGNYQLQVNYNTDRATAEIAALNAKITELQALLPDDIIALKITSCEKRIEYLNNNIPADPTQQAWCADLTEDLSGEVGTIEVPGEVGTVLIQPGYSGNAVYNSARDGQLFPSVVTKPAQTFYNLAMLPGWQKWKPTFRFGTITDINFVADTADVTLDAATSSQKSINVNQASALSDVVIDYLACNADAFTIGDKVLIKFTDQNWANPVIIGFKDNPRACEGADCANISNLVYNGCMELSDGWTQRTKVGSRVFDPNEKGGSISYNAIIFEEGARSLKMNMPGWASYPGENVSSSFSSKAFTTISDGPFYKLTGYIYVTSFGTPDNTGEISIILFRGDGSNLPDWRIRIVENNFPLNTWIELTTTAKTYQGGASAVLDIEVNGKDWQSEPVVYFDNISLIPI